MPQSKQPLEPMPGYAVLQEYKLEEKLAGRLFIPGDAQTKPSIGEVLLIGGPRGTEDHMTDERSTDKAVLLCIAVGDKIAYQNYGAQEIVLDGVKYLLVPFDKILAKLHIKE